MGAITAEVASPGRRLSGDAGVVAGWTLASRITGFLRIAIIGAVFGPTILANLYQATNVIPNVAYNLMAGSLVVSLLVPALIGVLDGTDTGRASRLAGAFLGVLLGISAVVAACVLIAEPLLGRLLTLGADESLSADAEQTVRLLLLLVVPQIALYAVASVAMAAQNARQHFALAAGAPVLENIGVIATVLVFAGQGGGGIEADAVSDAQLLTLGVGSTMAVGAHASLQWWGAARAGIVLRPNVSWRDPELRALLQRGRSALATAVTHALVLFVLTVAAATVPGGVVAFQLALQTVQLPIALGARPIAVALLPRLSSRHRSGDRDGFLTDLREGLWLSGVIAIPSTLALIAFSHLIGSTLAVGRMSATESIGLIAISLVSLAPSILGETTSELARSGLFARDNFVTPAFVSGVRALVVCTGAVVASLAEQPTVVLGILGLSLGAADVLAGHLLLRRLGGDLSTTRLATKAWLPTVIPAGAAVVAGAAIAWGVWSTELVPDSVALGLGALVAAATYLVTMRRTSPAFAAGVEQVVASLAPYRRNARFEIRLLTAAFGVVIVANMFALVSGTLVLAALAAVVVMGITVAQPVAAVYIYAATLPLLAGMERGSLVPLARPNEALLAVLVAALTIRGLWHLLLGHRPTLRFKPLDWGVLGFVSMGSVLPVLWLLARGMAVEANDVLEPLVLWRLAALYGLVRIAIRTAEQVRNTMAIVLVGAAGMALLAIVQALGLLGAGGEALLVRFWGPADVLDPGRASTTLASSLATGDYLSFALAIAVGWWCWRVRAGEPSTSPALLALLLLLGAFGSGQFSGWIAALTCGVVAASWFRMLGRLSRVAGPAVLAGVVVTWPVLSGRLAGFTSSFGVPRSWLGRIDNITTFYLPQLGDFGFVLGVRPNSTIVAPEQWREEIFLESGYLWLFWAGGIPLFIAFVWFMRRALVATQPAVDLSAPASVATAAARAAVVALLILMLIDKHLQLRGAGDLLFILLALALAEPRRQRARASASEEPRASSATGAKL